MKKLDKKDFTPIGDMYLKQSYKFAPETVEVRELSTEMNKDYMSSLINAAMRGKKEYGGTFYIVVLIKAERLIRTAIRNYFVPRKTCPTPNYDQTVYKYESAGDHLEFLWTVPSKKISNEIYAMRLDSNGRMDKLLPFVEDFFSGKLYEMALILNGEIKV